MKVTVLIENSSNSDLICEHGLSLFIEYNGLRYLLDAGSTDAFLENAYRLQVSVKDADICILSHGHYDHSGGFARFLGGGRTADIYAMRQVGEPHYSGSGGRLHEIGMPEEVWPVYKERFRLIDGRTRIADGVYLLPHASKNLEEIGARAGLYRMCGKKLLPDDFSHELSLVLDTAKGLVIFNSCSHAGIINIIEETKSAFPYRKLYAYLGGLHMKGKENGRETCLYTETEIRKIADVLDAAGLELLYTGHCTGRPAFEQLRIHLGNRVQELTTGRIILL